MTERVVDAAPALAGARGEWTWATAANGAGGELPSGVVIDHGDHELHVAWVTWPGGPQRVFTLDSLRPLTVVERIGCILCGAEGRIRQGAWLPSKGGAVGE